MVGNSKYCLIFLYNLFDIYKSTDKYYHKHKERLQKNSSWNVSECFRKIKIKKHQMDETV